MPSERSRYLNMRKQKESLAWHWSDLPSLLEKLPTKTLVDLLRIGAESSDPLRRALLIHASFGRFDGTSSEELENSVRLALDLSNKNIDYSESNSYAQIVYACEYVIRKLVDGRNYDLAKRIADLVLDYGEQGSEHLQDGHNWEMAVDDIAGLRDQIKKMMNRFC